MNGFPVPGEHESHVTAWLHPDERVIFDAHRCPDLTAHLTVSVVLAEYQARDARGSRKRVPRSKFTPEQHAREVAAGRLLGAYQRGAFNVSALLVRLAEERRARHYAEIGEEPPAIPPASEPTAEPVVESGA